MGLSGLGLVRAGGVLLITLHAKEDWQSRQAACPDGCAGCWAQMAAQQQLLTDESTKQPTTHSLLRCISNCISSTTLKYKINTLHFALYQENDQNWHQRGGDAGQQATLQFPLSPLTPKPTNLPFAVFSNLWQTQN